MAERDADEQSDPGDFIPLSEQQWDEVRKLSCLPDEARADFINLVAAYFADLEYRAGWFPLHEAIDLAKDINRHALALRQRLRVALDSAPLLEAFDADLRHFVKLASVLERVPECRMPSGHVAASDLIGKSGDVLHLYRFMERLDVILEQYSGTRIVNSIKRNSSKPGVEMVQEVLGIANQLVLRAARRISDDLAVKIKHDIDAVGCPKTLVRAYVARRAPRAAGRRGRRSAD